MDNKNYYATCFTKIVYKAITRTAIISRGGKMSLLTLSKNLLTDSVEFMDNKNFTELMPKENHTIALIIYLQRSCMYIV